MLKLYLFFFLLVIINLKSESVIDLSNHQQSDYIGKKLRYLEDKAGVYTLSDVLKPSLEEQFQYFSTDIPRADSTNVAYWCQFHVRNQGDDIWFLEYSFPHVKKLRFYAINEQEQVIDSVTTGEAIPFESRLYSNNNFIFKLNPKANKYILRLETNSTLVIPVHIYNISNLAASLHHSGIIAGIVAGVVLLIMLYNLIMFLGTKDQIYFYYFLYVLGVALMNAVYYGYAFEFVWPRFPLMNYYNITMICFGGMATVVFVMKFLKTSDNLPWLNYGFYLLSLSFLVCVLLDFIGESYVARAILRVDSMFIALYSYFAGILIYKKTRYRPALYFLIAWSFYLTGVVVVVLMYMGILPMNDFNYNAFQIGNIVEMVIMAFAIADRINRFKKQRDDAREEALLSLKENERLISVQKSNLEEQVKVRTEELVIRQQEIQKQNEKLKEANELILKQHHILKSYNEKLEEKVIARTKELQDSNIELLLQNSKLEQFAFIAAHNLRSPVSSLLGLVNIFDKTNKDKDINNVVIGKINSTTIALDNVIRDLNMVLDVKKEINVKIEKVDIGQVVEDVLWFYKSEIDLLNVKVSVEIKDFVEIDTIKSYFRSIITNLIGNAIKYKSDLRDPEIFVSVSRAEVNELCITVKDNGAGINLEKYGDKLFGLYKRFHLHVQGKGVGLYLTKTQVEALGGRVEVESREGEGTTFRVYLKVVKHEMIDN